MNDKEKKGFYEIDTKCQYYERLKFATYIMAKLARVIVEIMDFQTSLTLVKRLT